MYPKHAHVCAALFALQHAPVECCSDARLQLETRLASSATTSLPQRQESWDAVYAATQRLSTEVAPASPFVFPPVPDVLPLQASTAKSNAMSREGDERMVLPIPSDL